MPIVNAAPRYDITASAPRRSLRRHKNQRSALVLARSAAVAPHRRILSSRVENLTPRHLERDEIRATTVNGTTTQPIRR